MAITVHQLHGLMFGRIHVVAMGSAPAPGVVNRTLAVQRENLPLFGVLPCSLIRREGAPNRIQGGCAPQASLLQGCGFNQ